MRPRTLALASLSTLSILTLAIAGPISPAAAQPSQERVVSSIEFQGTDVREALRRLFKIAGVSYTIAPEIQGAVTASMRNVSFETALQNVVRQVDATYRIEAGVYHIVKREEPGTDGSAFAAPQPFPQMGPPVDPPAIAVDGNFVFVVQHGTLTKVDKKTMRIVGRVILGIGGPGGMGGGGFGR